MRVPKLCRPFVGITFALTIFITAVFGCYVVTLFLPVLLVGQHRRWRSLIDRAISFWLLLPMTYIEFVFGTESVVSGDAIDVNEPALIIMNHRTRLDWIYFWSALFRINPWLLTTNKIALKTQLKLIPAAGIGMAANAFIFLDRNLESDCMRLSEAIDYYSDMQTTYQLLFFPEGTDKTDYTTMRSNEYARKNGLKPLQYLLHPRTAGFAHLVQKMRSVNYIRAVYDVTIAYPDRIIQSELQLGLAGRGPHQVQYDIRRIDIDQVPIGEHDVQQWLVRLWQAKDERLRAFYSETDPSKRILCLDASAGDARHLWRETNVQRVVKVFAFTLWFFVMFIWTWHTFILPMIQIGLLITIVTHVLILCVYGGIDRFVLHRWRYYKMLPNSSRGACCSCR